VTFSFAVCARIKSLALAAEVTALRTDIEIGAGKLVALFARFGDALGVLTESCSLFSSCFEATGIPERPGWKQ